MAAPTAAARVPEARRTSAATPTTREANPEARREARAIGVLERTVVRVEGMDCASCAATVEKRVGGLPGVRSATVNFAAGRLDAEHDPAWRWRRSRAPSGPPATGWPRRRRPRDPPSGAPRGPSPSSPRPSLFALGLALTLAGAPEIARAGAYLAAIAVGGVPIFRAAIAGLRARHLDMNVLMSAATIGAVGIGQWAEAASVVVLFAAGNALQVYAIDRTRGAVRALAGLAPGRGPRQEGRLRGRRPGGRGRRRRYGGRQARREAGGGRQGSRGLLRGGRGPGYGRERARGEGPRRRGLLRLPQRPGRAARRGDQAGRGLDAAEDRAPRRGGAGVEGPFRAVRGPLLARLHARGGGRGRRARRRAPPARGGLRGVVLQGAGAAHHRLPVRAGDLHARHRGLRDRGRLQAGHPRQGRGGAGGGGAAQGPRLRQDRHPHRRAARSSRAPWR